MHGLLLSVIKPAPIDRHNRSPVLQTIDPAPPDGKPALPFIKGDIKKRAVVEQPASIRSQQAFACRALKNQDYDISCSIYVPANGISSTVVTSRIVVHCSARYAHRGSTLYIDLVRPVTTLGNFSAYKGSRWEKLVSAWSRSRCYINVTTLGTDRVRTVGEVHNLEAIGIATYSTENGKQEE